jgi:hypothetical protein
MLVSKMAFKLFLILKISNWNCLYVFFNSFDALILKISFSIRKYFPSYYQTQSINYSVILINFQYKVFSYILTKL